MRLPNIKGEVPSVIHDTEVLSDLGVLLPSLKNLARIYLNTGGNRKMKWGKDASLAAIADYLMNSIQGRVGKVADKFNFEMKACKHSSLGMSIKSSFGNSLDIWIEVELGYWYSIELKALDAVSKKDPELAELVRLCLIGLSRTGWCNGLNEYYDHIMGDYLDDLISEGGESADHAKSIIASSKVIIKFLECKNKNVAPLINKQYAKIKKRLNEKQRGWVEKVLAFLKFSHWWWREGKKNVAMDECDYGEWGVLPSEQFVFNWDNDDGLSQEYAENINNTLGEYGPARFIFPLQGLQSIAAAKRLAYAVAELQSIFYFTEEALRSERIIQGKQSDHCVRKAA